MAEEVLNLIQTGQVRPHQVTIPFQPEADLQGFGGVSIGGRYYPAPAAAGGSELPPTYYPQPQPELSAPVSSYDMSYPVSPHENYQQQVIRQQQEQLLMLQQQQQQQVSFHRLPVLVSAPAAKSQLHLLGLLFQQWQQLLLMLVQRRQL